MSIIAPWLPGLLWGLPFAGIPAIARRRPDVADAPHAGGIALSVIIPARNESATIETVLGSILTTHYDTLEVIVVDDRSTDDTAALVEAISSRDARVTLVRGADLPDGWMGKPWACFQGAQIATGDILLFTDADTQHQPDLLPHAVGAMLRDDAALVTLTSQQRCLTFWERIVMPQIWMLLALRYTPERVNRATRPDQLVANGQFILVQRAAYDAVGGHETVKGQVVEDLALAQHFMRHGQRLRMYFGETLIETRMYRSLGELVEGWSKNLYLGARISAPPNRVLRVLAPFSLMAALLFWLVPIIMLVTGIAPTAALVGVGISVLFWSMVSFGMQIPAWYGFAYPLGAVTALLIALRSVARGRRQIVWRGRSYRVDARDA